ncbi:ABC transporter ATP-binding protein [Exiguobacterium sp. SH1S21]|uniref:ABC transporter ATP-binding protein n=1 Tax=Exiguobacterium sp. SH1S21 TaxID=2510953 RepID=UPI00103F105C|nr:ABC transporter ATP-binding protein [Exiguobacterium sp. SH1S21]TCI53221.1 ABC transporter ATP-binding protein [Exiguobacterium sp. SH1S21]
MGSIRRYLQFVKPYKKQIALTIFVGILKFSIPLGLPLLYRYVIDNYLTDLDPAADYTELVWLFSIVFFIFLVLKPPIEYLRQYLAQWAATRILFDVRNRLFDHVQKLSLRYYSNNKTGQIISRIINDVEQTKDFVITGLMNIWLDMVTILIAIAIMYTIDPQLTLIAVLPLPFYAIAVRYFYGRLRRLTRERSAALADLQGHLTERVNGMAVIRSFALEPYENKAFEEQNGGFLRAALRHTGWNAKTYVVVSTITDIAPILIFTSASWLVLQEQVSLGTLVAFIAYIDRLYAPLGRLVNSATTLTQSVASMDRVFEFLDEPYDIEQKRDAFVPVQTAGDIELDGVGFAYEKEGTRALHDVSLHIRSGERVAFVGMSGGGKSTLVSLIPRFYDVTDGSIKIDGVDVRDFKLRALRDQIGMVMQDSVLFSESVAMNIRMGNPEATDDAVIAAAKAANAHEFIMNLQDGYNTPVGEKGVKLSGGQKQRLAIARVFLKHPPIIILDEATSALDLESESMIQDSLARLTKGRTTLIVAHRLSTITDADKIVVVDNGRIMEAGTHEELMRRRGAYYDLYMIQDLAVVE